MKKLVITSFALIMMMSCTKQEKTNPFFSDYDTPFGVPPFEQIDTTHYMPAFEEGIKQHDAEIAAIIANQETPNFKNTIEAFDFSGELLKKVSLVFFSLTEAETNDGLQRIAKAVSPLLSEHSDNVSLNDSLFARIKTVYDNREKENLTAEQLKVLEEYYKDFVRSGALLSAADKEQLREINTELAKLSIEYGDNVLTETNAFELVIDKKEDLAGLPEGVIAAAAAEAKSRNKEGWIFTLDAPSRIPFLQYSDNRDLREKIYKGYINRSDNDNKNDNKAIVSKMVNLRLKKANLMGYKTFADFALDDRMAKTDENVNNLVNRVWSYAIPRAKEEAADMQEMIDAEGGNFKLAPWDWWYYAEKVRKAKYDLNEDELKPYFSLDNVREGAFMVANKLYGITFTELKNMPVYHPDVKVFEVKDENGKHLAVFYADYFPRAGKRAGAWMSNFRESYVKDGKEIRPVIYNVCNFTKPAGDVPSLLTIDEVQTLFHEFGHALHGMLTKCNYLRVSGTSVARDFVELPSQINEHWATAPEVLKMYAKHYQTGEIIPDSLIAKMENASKFNQGFATTEFLAAGILDMRWHEISEPQEFDVRAFERNVAKEIGLIDEITFRYRSTYFSHIFTNDYCAGYYSYVWAEVLDADAFDAFKEHGIFDPATAKSFRENILEKGGSEDPMALYKKFRGADPNPESLLHNRGLK
ncbi:M3 family metallopeptidase [Barnesiella propionica]|uniref:M3 family metallopeptidase n=1 Tax=Barnesiella propionica TaxID=2981781 RepID=UPI0011C8D98E|nr:M3 family metallopeptidase [Barnesiella propionica]MCU6769525.1 M3 family metallopeptidase [Barnesiella propionica]